jgi:hypothetical protein
MWWAMTKLPAPHRENPMAAFERMGPPCEAKEPPVDMHR